MPKILYVTEEMKQRAANIGKDTSDILEIIQRFREGFQRTNSFAYG